MNEGVFFMSEVGDVIKGFCAILLILFVLVAILSVFDDTYPFNTTETVVGKDISHTDKFMGSNNQYNIYTTNNSFNVLLKDYNQIKKGDNLTIEYDDFGSPILYYNNRTYHAT